MSLAAIQPYAPFALLGAALLVFLLSTRQWSVWARSLIWLIGAGSLAGAVVLAQDENHYGLYGLVSDALRSGFSHSALKQTLVGNWRTVTGNLSPMFDIVTAMAALLAIVALIAFTPGENLERTIRPVFLMLFGAIIGGFLALAFVALGLGGYQKDRVYAGQLTADNVIDGDTLKLGDISLRLWGVDAPEYDEGAIGPTAHNQFCGARNCGDAARRKLISLVEGKTVVCGRPADERPFKDQLRETFGRPLVTCKLYGNEGPQDIALWLVRDGYADVYRDRDGVPKSSKEYCSAVKAARDARKELWGLGMAPPSRWRREDLVRLPAEPLDIGTDAKLDACATNAPA